MHRNWRAPLLLSAFFLLTGMAGMGGGQTSGAQLKPEIRLKIYNEAIRHYEMAQSLYAEGRKEEALHELRHATKIVRAFPEVYELSQKIYLELGKVREADEQAGFFEFYGGKQGASLLRLRNDLIRLVKRRIKLAPPPDIQRKPALQLSGVLAAILFLGMFYDVYRKKRSEKARRQSQILLGSFAGDDEDEVRLSWLFKLCALFFPAPLIVFLLLFLGVRYYSDFFPVFLFAWVIIDLAVFLIFFADFSDFGSGGGGGGFRGPRGMGLFL